MMRDFQYFTLAPSGFEETSQQYVFEGVIEAVGDASILQPLTLQYRFVYDKENEENGASEWQPYEAGQKLQHFSDTWFGVQFRNSSGSFSDNGSTTQDNYYHISTSYELEVGGKIMSLINYMDDSVALPESAFFKLFYATPIHDAIELILPNETSNDCYRSMFANCKTLKSAPELPAPILATSCYSNMFQDCTSLTAAPASLPATSLAIFCYNQMFQNCTALTNAPALPAASLAYNCYNQMFQGCTSLTQAPELPATTLAEKCYYYMFSGCTSLTSAPSVLPATTLALNCYANMFQGCTSLTQAPELPATTLAEKCYYGMFQGCTSLTQAPELPATTLADSCCYGMFNGCTSLTAAPELPATTLAEKCYYYMFQDCTSLTTAPSVLPATTLKNNCYYYMFSGCRSLTTTPELPATTLANNCYQCMFNNCKALTKAPELPATTLATSCYSSMFQDCTSLTQAPELPASTLAQYCYAYMFQKCTALTEAPDMYATNLVNYCCQHMFNGCTNLNHIIWRSKTVPSVSFCNSWLVNASTSGTFEYTQPFLDVASIERNVSGVPAGWNIQQLKPQAGGISLKINNVDVKKVMMSGKNIAKLFINGVKVKSSTPIGTDIELPSQYTKLLYVDSNGGTIDTGIPTTGDLKVGIKWSKTKSGNSTWPELFGNKSVPGFHGDYYKAFALQLNSNGAGTQFGAHYCFFHGLYSPTEQTYGGRVDIMESDPNLSDTVNEFWLSPTEFSWNGQMFNIVEYANLYGVREYNDWEYQPNRLDGSNMFLFTSKTGNREAIVNCYNFYIVDTSTNTVLVNYVPCKQGTQAGFYDTVSQTFVTNSKFIAGPEA